MVGRTDRDGGGIGRRRLLAGIAAASLTGAGPARSATAREFRPDGSADQTEALSRALRQAAGEGLPLRLGSGEYRVNGLVLPPDTILMGSGPRTILVQAGPKPILVAEVGAGLRLSDLALRGSPTGDAGTPLLRVADVARLDLSRLTFGPTRGTALEALRCGGRIADCLVEEADVGIHALDSSGLAIAGNIVRRCRNNGIRVWTSAKRYDGTLVTGNRLSEIGAEAGGSGQNGNGINVFRAGGVVVAHNVARGCAFSAIRANAADNVQITGNQCFESGEVAIFVEFGFQGAVVASNLVQKASAGISITNFDQGGRLASVTGNVIRAVARRPEPLTGVPNQGYGIAAEADTVISGNVVEDAEFAGLLLGYGRFLRDVTATGNIVRQAGSGIAVSVAPGAGAAQIEGNTLVGCARGIVGYAWDEIAAPDLPAAASRYPLIALARNAIR